MIRPARFSDIPSILEIEKLSFNRLDRFTRSQIKYGINHLKNAFIVYVDEYDVPIGYIYVLSGGRIYSIAVHPDSRNKRIGQRLLGEAERLCKNLLKVTLEVRKDNRPAIRFYLNNGYTYLKERLHYYDDGMDAIVLKKDLGNADRRLAESSDTL